ncbi:MAG: peptidoglycan bridge formation glycyltransferase FemA/FemB family protein [Candidatus Nealsonbacteria bacterium]|nr:peptidoglycan bridge formation glycyltransferase FemA/FemB family protein [Candidatus Nealsonbacteria bacterium]
MAFYHHGASLSKFNKIPVSYLLQWEAIKEAKKRGCILYNFWGIAPEIASESDASKSKHPWAGLSLFKMGFGGYRKDYVKTQDYPITLKYYLNYIIEKIRKIKRRL